jgi:REP element-mobilizing transposase RayT
LPIGCQNSIFLIFLKENRILFRLYIRGEIMPGQRRSIRLKRYDYAQQGAYYVTICVGKHVCRGASRSALTNETHNVFGHVENGKMVLNDIGRIIRDSWLWLANQYNYVNLDEYIVMPNHVHGIVFLTGPIDRGQDQGVRGQVSTLDNIYKQY